MGMYSGTVAAASQRNQVSSSLVCIQKYEPWRCRPNRSDSKRVNVLLMLKFQFQSKWRQNRKASYGDTLQILQTLVHAALATMSSAGNETLASHLADALLTGELRQLV